MLTENREYHFLGELTIKRSHLLSEQSQPVEDKVQWFFLKAKEQNFSFVYKIEEPLLALYGQPFKAKLAFTMIESVKELVQLNYNYEVLRGQEIIGTVKLLANL